MGCSGEQGVYGGLTPRSHDSSCHAVGVIALGTLQHYGLGIAPYQAGDVELSGHLGGTAGFQGFVLFQHDSGTVVSGDMNRQGDLGAFIVPVLEALGRLP